jgi:hypothetical protein
LRFVVLDGGLRELEEPDPLAEAVGRDVEEAVQTGQGLVEFE